MNQTVKVISNPKFWGTRKKGQALHETRFETRRVYTQPNYS